MSKEEYVDIYGNEVKPLTQIPQFDESAYDSSLVITEEEYLQYFEMRKRGKVLNYIHNMERHAKMVKKKLIEC